MHGSIGSPAVTRRKPRVSFSGPEIHSPIPSAPSSGIRSLRSSRALAEDWPLEELDPVLDRFIRIRAVQEFPPGDAVAFILDLKSLVREHLGSSVSEVELAAVDAWVDRLLLRVFTVYVRCRDEMHDIRVEAIRSQSLTVIERLNAWRTKKYGDEEGQDSEPEEAH